MPTPMTLSRMPGWLRAAIPHMDGITLPPFGVYLRPGHEQDDALIRHEAVHWAQYERMGILRFYSQYLWQLAWYGYEQHPMEQEARAKAFRQQGRL